MKNLVELTEFLGVMTESASIVQSISMSYDWVVQISLATSLEDKNTYSRWLNDNDVRCIREADKMVYTKFIALRTK